MKSAMNLAPFLAALLLTLSSAAAWSQPGAPVPPPRPAAPGSPPVQSADVPGATGLSKFDLDFPGGTPKALVDAIQKAMGKPLNAIIPDEYANTKLPALRMKYVDVAQLFSALQAATTKTVVYASSSYYGGGAYGGYKSYQQAQINCGFKSVSDKPTDDTIWYFYVQQPAFPEVAAAAKGGKVCRFYSLAPYLERHLTVDDITTAIETGWKMLGEPSPAAIKFHKDTKLLIAVGEPSALETIDAVLKALEEPKPAVPPVSRVPAPKAGEFAPPSEAK
jgi:hypothetical protein